MSSRLFPGGTDADTETVYVDATGDVWVHTLNKWRYIDRYGVLTEHWGEGVLPIKFGPYMPLNPNSADVIRKGLEL